MKKRADEIVVGDVVDVSYDDSPYGEPEWQEVMDILYYDQSITLCCWADDQKQNHHFKCYDIVLVKSYEEED